MDSEAITSYEVLERMLLDEDAKPMQLSLSLLKEITHNFSPSQIIGKGGFAEVYKGTVGRGMVAVKKLTTFNLPENKFHEEIKCLIKANHKNIVRFLGYCSDTQGKMADYQGSYVMADQRNWLICFEYVSNGSLDKHITDASCGLQWTDRYRIIRGICEGLLFLHVNKIIHLDLKPANILMDYHMVPKIADFGLSRILGDEQSRVITKNISGTRGYMDPEYYTTGQFSRASDIYSLGVVIMEILAGVKWDFEAENIIESWMNRLGASEGDMQLEQVRVCTQIGIECRDSDPKKRPITQHIIERLDKTESADYSDQKADVEEQSEIFEYVAEHLGSLHLQEGKQIVGQIPLWRVQDTKENANYNEATSSSSMSTGMNELKYFDILRKKTLRSFDRSNWPTLEKSHLISIFRKDELKPILRSSNFIGKGDFAEVYKGVVDNTPVVVKKAINDNVHKNIELENEVIIQSQILHKNIVLLIGCCLEMDTPVLVYEFLPGSLHDILHSRTKEPLSLDVRLNIVAESAHGLAYMHSQAHTKILHGDVKPASILLDDNLVPKISDFGLSRVILRDKKNAYMDPGLSNEKSDVYSFGIVILEVISRKEATGSDGFSLVKNFLEIHKEGKKATELFDKDISTTAKDLDLVDSLADIAVECLNPDVQQRPSMTDVAERLRILNRSRRFHAQHIVVETRRADYSARTYISSSLMEQQKSNELPLWGMQDTSNHGASISSSISTGFYKFSNLEIFNRKARRNFDKNRISTLQKSHFIKIFREDEIKPIINNSDLIGEGGRIDVYSGYLDDARVAVRRHRDVSKSMKNKLENEVIILSQIIHTNIVKLIGYCLEKDTYVLVHEFISGETLHDILHRSRAPLNLNVRLTILAESAQGLAYLHSETHVKIWHCDVRSENILLDPNFIPKISGLHRMKLIQKDRVKDYSVFGRKANIPKAYIDPYYMSTGGVLTEKSDVYSFGVVILEVITRREQPGDQRFVKSFLEVHKEGKKATELFDQKIAVTTGDLEVLDFLAEIAVACLNYDVDQRPTMTSVAERLLTVQRYHRSLPSARVTAKPRKQRGHTQSWHLP